MKSFIAILVFVAGCSASHANLNTEVVINGVPTAGNILCTDIDQSDCQVVMVEFCKGNVKVVKRESDQVCYVNPSLTNGRNKDDRMDWDKTCDNVKSVSFVCE